MTTSGCYIPQCGTETLGMDMGPPQDVSWKNPSLFLRTTFLRTSPNFRLRCILPLGAHSLKITRPHVFSVLGLPIFCGILYGPILCLCLPGDFLPRRGVVRLPSKFQGSRFRISNKQRKKKCWSVTWACRFDYQLQKHSSC